MKADSLDRRLAALEATAPKPDGWGKILSQCTDQELDRYGEIALRYEDHLGLTEEENAFLEGLVSKYAHES